MKSKNQCIGTGAIIIFLAIVVILLNSSAHTMQKASRALTEYEKVADTTGDKSFDRWLEIVSLEARDEGGERSIELILNYHVDDMEKADNITLLDVSKIMVKMSTDQLVREFVSDTLPQSEKPVFSHAMVHKSQNVRADMLSPGDIIRLMVSLERPEFSGNMTLTVYSQLDMPSAIHFENPEAGIIKKTLIWP